MKGKILKIKTGYNPNSSSIGADIVVFFTAGAALTLFFNATTAIIAAVKAERDGEQPCTVQPDPENRGVEE